jgi:AraC-like DNA-binding protein
MQVLKAGYERTLYLRSSRLNRFRGCIVFEVSPLLRELIGALEVATDGPARFRRLIHSLIVEEVDRARQLPIRITFPEDPRLRRVCDAVIMRRGKPLELAEAAALAAMSSRTLSRLFLDRTGASYGQWCQQVMLSFAIEDLCQGASVAEVAHSLGYASQSAFTTMFRKNMGESPKRFASNHGQGGAGP